MNEKPTPIDHTYYLKVDEKAVEITRLRDRVALLEAVLRPFAEMGEDMSKDTWPQTAVIHKYGTAKPVKVCHFRAAASALSHSEGHPT